MGELCVKTLLALAASLLLALVGCDSLFYYPDRIDYPLPLKPGQVAEEVEFPSSDGVLLYGRFIPSRKQPAIGTVIHFHGNAQNLTSHYWFVDWMPEDGFNVFQFDYRGFGKSGLKRLRHTTTVTLENAAKPGGGGDLPADSTDPADVPPTREGVFQDCVAALQYVQHRKDVDPAKIVGFGQSLGAAAMLGAIGETDPQSLRGVVVENSFLSYRRISRRKAEDSWLLCWVKYPASWLLISNAHSPEDSLERLNRLPALFIHGDADSVVPVDQGWQLFQAWQGPKHWVTAHGADHLQAREFWGDAYYRTLVGGFFQACIARKPEAPSAR